MVVQQGLCINSKLVSERHRCSTAHSMVVQQGRIRAPVAPPYKTGAAASADARAGALKHTSKKCV
ncbi:hypothetical protein KDAU_13920 [Dictyobacter aurantiacus]|uniref:Uncharacterized protein n=1 Tax=Dictyobacter aurantiacus TaxID=1936993 RepID=A0A401ZBD6_9CHLR|nr:hypothetical protein KDAU_13920 [Dictyobacter aurantiacus]